MQNSMITLPMTVMAEKIGFEVCNCVEKNSRNKSKASLGEPFLGGSSAESEILGYYNKWQYQGHSLEYYLN